MECLNCHQAEMVTPNDEHPSYVVCPACDAIELMYEPQDHQSLFHQTPYRYNPDGSIQTQIIGVFGGYGSSKSTATLWEFFLRALENPNGIGLVTAPTLALLKKTTLKTLIDEIIPPPLLESYNKTDMTLTLTNGYTIYAIPSDDDEKLRSINAGHVHVEEASGVKRSIYDQLLSRMRHQFVKNKAMFVCSNPEFTWIKDVIVDNDKRKNPKHPEHEDYNPNISCYIWESRLNKYLPADFIENLAKGRPEWWRRKYLEGSFEASEGSVYPNVASTMCDPFPIPKHWERGIGADFGLVS